MPKAGLTVAVDSGHWQGRGGINSERREGNGVGKDGPAQPSLPRTQGPGPRTREMLDAQYTRRCRQAGRQSSQAGKQADRQALQIRHA